MQLLGLAHIAGGRVEVSCYNLRGLLVHIPLRNPFFEFSVLLTFHPRL